MNDNPFGPAPGQLPPSGYGHGGGGPPQDDTLAWAGIVCSSISWVTCCCLPIPMLGFLGGFGGTLLAIAGIVCGWMALENAKRTKTRTDLANIGLWLGVARLVTTGLVLVVVMGALVLGIGIAGLEAYTHPR